MTIQILVQATGRFSLASFGGGISYLITDHIGERQTYLQGDDARRFEREREEARIALAGADDQALLAWLWDERQYGVGAARMARMTR